MKHHLGQQIFRIDIESRGFGHPSMLLIQYVYKSGRFQTSVIGHEIPVLISTKPHIHHTQKISDGVGRCPNPTLKLQKPTTNKEPLHAFHLREIMNYKNKSLALILDISLETQLFSSQNTKLNL